MDFTMLDEVISKDRFHALLSQVMEEASGLSPEENVYRLEVLGERYCKFYDEQELTPVERERLFALLTTLTDFTELSLIESLCGLLFCYSLNEYADWLKENVDGVTNPDIRWEVIDTLEEYNRG